MTAGSRQCTAIKADGMQCRKWAVPGTEPALCHMPGDSEVRGSEPPRCAAHGGGKRRVGPPEGSTNALKHGVYLQVAPVRPVDPAEADLPPLRRLMLDLVAKHARLSAYIDIHLEKEGLPAIAHLFELHARTAWRLGWVMHQHRLHHPDEVRDESNRLMNEFYDELEKSLGIAGPDDKPGSRWIESF